MKKILLFYSMILLIGESSYSQTTIEIRPNASAGKDALINSQTSMANSNFGSSEDFASWSWTSGGPTNARSLIQFDFSAIPVGATITSAYLNLYCNTTSAITQLHSGTNLSNLKRVTTNWDEITVTWNNQPTTTTQNMVTLATSTSATQDYLNIDVTNLIVDSRANPGSSFGFMLALQTETTYRSMILASSDHSNVNKRPQLIIVYSVPIPLPPVGCVIFRPDTTNGKDALVDSRTAVAGTNFGSTPDFAAWSWTISGSPTIARSLISFQIPNLSTGSIFKSAKLSLYCNTTSSISQLHSGNNAAYLRRITGSWTESVVAWNSQPGVSFINQVSLEKSTSNNQNYVDIDVTNLLLDAVNASQSELGLLLMLQGESDYRSLVFASSEHPDSTKRPRLEICVGFPEVNLIQPLGFDTLFSHYTYPVKWQNKGVAAIHIQYSNDGTNWNTIASNVNANLGQFNWTPDFSSPACKIRIISTTNSLVGDTSNNDFIILPEPTLQVISPNGGELWLGSTLQQIQWVDSNLIGNLNIEYSGNGGLNWTVIDSNIASNLGTYYWRIPEINSVSALVRLRSVKYTFLTDQSDSLFVIRKSPTFSLVSPNGGEFWLNNLPRQIVWNSSNSTRVKLSYSLNGSDWITLVDNLPNTGSYYWSLPTLYSNTISIRVADLYYPEYNDTSDARFTISPPPQLHLISPNGSETWYFGTSQRIRWSAGYSKNLRIDYTTDNLTWNPISFSYPSDSGFFEWVVPSVLSTNVRVRITDVNFTNYGDTSDAYFEIVPLPMISLISPNGGNQYVPGSTQPITWICSGVQNLNIFYNQNGGPWISIAGMVDATLGSFSWTLPTFEVLACRIKLVNLKDSNIFDVSENPFAIKMPIGLIENSTADYSFYPNPSYSGEFTFQHAQTMDSEFEIKLFNTRGEEIYSGLLQTGDPIKLHDQPSGIFIGQLKDVSGGIYRFKLLLVK